MTRISTRMLQQDAILGLRARLASVHQAERQATTGRRIQQVSDAPQDAAQVMRLDGQLRDIEQFRRNGLAATTVLASEEAVLESVSDLISRLKALVTSASSEDTTDPVRQAAVAEARLIHQHLVSLGNTRIGGEYIFGGGRTTSPPFLKNGTYLGGSKVRQVQIDSGSTVVASRPGNVVLSAALDSAAALVVQLETGTPDSIRAQLPSLQSASDGVMIRRAEVGTSLGQIQDTSQLLAIRSSTLGERRDGLRDVDPTEAMLGLVSAKDALERAYAAIGRTLSNSLVDYLR